MTGFQEEKKKAPFKGQGNMKPCGQETNEMSEKDFEEVSPHDAAAEKADRLVALLKEANALAASLSADVEKLDTQCRFTELLSQLPEDARELQYAKLGAFIEGFRHGCGN